MHPKIPHNFDDAFEIGELTMCNNDNPFKTERLLIQEDDMYTNPTLNNSLENALFPFSFPHGCGAYDGIGGLLPYLKQKMSTLFISTILTHDVPNATSNSTIKCYKTFMFREGCTKIKTPTSSMVKNSCSREYYEVQVTTLYSINATMAPYPIQRVIGDGGELWSASFFPRFDF